MLSPFQGYEEKTSLSVRINKNHNEIICQDSNVKHNSFLKTIEVEVNIAIDFKNGKSSWSRLFLIITFFKKASFKEFRGKIRALKRKLV